MPADCELTFLNGGGDMGTQMRAHDWSTSPLGDPATWPQSLRTTVSLMLNSRYPMFVAWGPQLAFLYNDGYRPIFGAKHPHTLGLPFAEVWSEIWDDIRPLVERALAGESTFNENLHLIMERSGYPEDTWYTFSYSPVRDESGSVGGMFCACQETTSQVLADRRRDFRLDLEERLRGWSDPHAIMAIAAQSLGRHLGVGRCGYGEFEPTGEFLTVEREWTDGDQATLVKRLRLDNFIVVIDELRAGRIVRFDDVLTDPRSPAAGSAIAGIDVRAGIVAPLVKAGRLIAVFYVLQTAPRRWTDGEIALVSEVAERTWGAVDAARAEVNLRQSEAALRQLTADLEQRVVKRTRQREEALAKVHELQKMETIGQLTGGVAHDFNNLLLPITGVLELLRRRPGNDETVDRLISGALQSAERARTLISRLLTFAGRQHLQPCAVDISALVAGMEDLVARSIGPQIKVSFSARPDLPAARVDPGQLELAILNLAVNARDAMPGGGELQIEVTSADAAELAIKNLAPGSYVGLRVSDTGHGMDTETLKRAIEPFFSTKGVGKGTGLGLSMVHGLASQSGGTLRLSSTPGQGTVATLWLPVAQEVAQNLAKVSDDTVATMSPRTILLVEDEELVREATGEMLRGLGHKVHEAAFGVQGLEILNRESGIDLLISDYLMPGMSGAEFVLQARAMRPDIPALLITGYTNLAKDIGRGLPSLAKPFRQVELAAALAELVGNARGSRAMAAR